MLSRSWAAAAAEGARPSTWPQLSVHALVRARSAVVLPAPAGAMASWSRAPDMLIDRTRAACPGSKVTPLAACSSSARSTISAGAHPPVPVAGDRDESLFGGQNASRGKQLGASHGVDARPIAAAQGRRFGDRHVWPSQRHRSGVEDLSDDTVDKLIDPTGGTSAAADLALRLGADMPGLPGRAALLQRGQHQARRRRHPLRQSPEISMLAVAWSASLIMACTASGPPSVSAACVCQVVRCSASVRGSCLASRVSKVAC